MWIKAFFTKLFKSVDGKGNAKSFNPSSYYVNYKRSLCANTRLNPYSVDRKANDEDKY